ncbi:ABC transporter B family member [Arachis hypogaea]|nr:ABC transporter B family member [Arachis hypogaea]
MFCVVTISHSIVVFFAFVFVSGRIRQNQHLVVIEVRWFDEEEHNSNLMAARFVTDAADLSLSLLREFQSFYRI